MKRAKHSNSSYNTYNKSQSIKSESKVVDERLGEMPESNSHNLPGKTLEKVISQEEADKIYKRLKNEAESRASHGM
jgi:hypothetical protein